MAVSGSRVGKVAVYRYMRVGEEQQFFKPSCLSMIFNPHPE